MKFALWIVECKTPKCPATHPVKYLGEYKGQRQYPVLAGIPAYFDFHCAACGNTHRYTADDFRVKIVPFLPIQQVPEWW